MLCESAEKASGSSSMVNVLKFRTLSLNMLVIRAEIHKIWVRIAIREDTDQTASKAVWLSTWNHYSW